MLENNLSDPLIMQKYRLASNLCNLVIKEVMDRVVPGVSCADLCAFADELIVEKCALAPHPKVKKGISLPTTIGVNNGINYAPRHPATGLSAPTPTILQVGDLVKIELGVHIDGYAVQTGHTTVLSITPDEPVTGPMADVVAAAHFAAETAWRLIRPGASSTAVSRAVTQVARAYNCAPVRGTFTKRIARFSADAGNHLYSTRDPTPVAVTNGAAAEFTFGVNEAYDVAIYLASRPLDADPTAADTDADTGMPATTAAAAGRDPTIYARDMTTRYQLRVAAARKLLSHVMAETGGFPVNAAALTDSTLRFGLKECSTHGLLRAMPVTATAQGTYVAAFRFTVLVLPSGQVLRLSLPHVSLPYVYSERELPAECAKLLAVDDGKLLRVPAVPTVADVSPARKRSRSASRRKNRSKSRERTAAGEVMHVDASELPPADF
ncbi:peptidase M24, structural domain-containing protein [Blastocladiella britannica]|nr:peptidase M24, structural domain-containing protein [Blastocladiella britannica]